MSILIFTKINKKKKMIQCVQFFEAKTKNCLACFEIYIGIDD